MRILYLITGLGVGGAEKVVTALADEMDARGHTVMVVYLTGPAIVKPDNRRIVIESLELESAKDLISSFVALIKLVREFKPDVVHSHMIHANILARLARPFCRVRRLVCTAHNSNEGGRARMVAYRLTNSLADVSTNVSAEAVKSFEDLGAVRPGEMQVVHNGICTDTYQYSEQDRKALRREFSIDAGQTLILAVGRLFEQKDYPTLLRALAYEPDALGDYHLVVAGDGPMRQQLTDLVQSLNLEGRVTFAGVRSDINRLMSAADIFVLSSAWEGFGLVVAEAMACERVVVATNCGGVSEVLGDCGYLVPAKSSEKLSAALKKVCALNEPDRGSIGKQARQRIIDHYSLAASADKWEALYQ